MSKVMKDFRGKFQIEQLKLNETTYWIWSLRPVQVTLGSGILSLKRECATFSDLRAEEFSDLNNIIGVIEKTLKTAFDYDIVNYLMLMMVDKQVHYHVIPRYERTIDFSGYSWSDSGWPGVPNLYGSSSEVEVLDRILNKIKKSMAI